MTEHVDLATGEILQEEPRNALNSRRLLTTGSVADVLALYPTPAATTPPNGSDLTDLIDAEHAKPDTDAVIVLYRDRDVENARKAIRATGIAEFIDALIDDIKLCDGRGARVTTQALLVAMWLAAESKRPMLLNEFADILFRGLSPIMRNVLSVDDGVVARQDHIPVKRRMWNKSATEAVRRCFQRMVALIDPSDEITQRENVFWEEMRYRGLSDAQMGQLQVLLDWVCNQLIQVTYNMLPESCRQADMGDRCIDATPIPMFTTSRGLKSEEAMSMPQAANYVREGDHRDPDEHGKRGRKKAKFFPALDAHLLVVTDITPGEYQRIPGLVTAMTTDRAALDPAGNARRLFASEEHRGFKHGYLTGDLLYARAKDATFQIPAREYGYKVILPLDQDHIGLQGTHSSGALLVDGTYYCAAMPQILITAVADLRAKRIDYRTYLARLAGRKQYELVTKQNPKKGLGERVGCRAADHSLTVSCSQKPASMSERLTRDSDGELTDIRPVIELPIAAITNGHAPRICQCQTMTLKPTDGAKYRQAIPIGDKHTDIFNRLRQTQEGMHGFFKDEAKEAIGSSSRRRIRTKVAQQLFVAFLLAAANVRKIRTFLEKAHLDEHDNYVVKRTPRKGEHARTGLPPGTDPDANAPPEAPLEAPAA